ncbi:general transcription factor 3C polypeptide 2 [Pelodytes ibericus]
MDPPLSEHQADITMGLGRDDSDDLPPAVPAVNEAMGPVTMETAAGCTVKSTHLASGGHTKPRALQWPTEQPSPDCPAEEKDEDIVLIKKTPTSTKKRPGRPPKHKRNLILASPMVPVSPSPSLPAVPEIVSSAASPLTPAAKAPKKRGRKSKAELLLLRLAQPPETTLEETPSNTEEVETTASGRPQRRAAKTALMYLQDLEDDWSGPGLSSPSKPTSREPSGPEEPGRKRRKRKAEDADEDFVVSEYVLQEAETEEAETERLSEASDSELSTGRRKSTLTQGEKSSPALRGLADNGFHNSIMAPVWKATEITNEFQNSSHSHWEFPEWIPHTDNWRFLSAHEAEDYLPTQAISPPFTVQREGIKQDGDPCTLGRFQSLPPHPERWDVTFFVGGPVWSMEWCPTVSGSESCQYLSLYCHKAMDERNRLDVTRTAPALLQLWSLGPMDMKTGSGSRAVFSYGLAMDHGCIWDMKFCPSGGWELPSTPKKSSQMARLGILATAFSSGYIEIYSLPHPESLYTHRKAQVKGSLSDDLTVCQVDCVVRLQVGSIKSCHLGENGQCFTLAWLPSVPHNYLAAGFYDGTVSIWDLKTKSVLQRVRQGRVIKQYPFHSFLAHDHAVRNIEWCKADSHFLVTGGTDRRLKFWDLRRIHEPIHNIKRFQSTEISWLLPYCGVLVAQDNCYASHGLCGIHYVDSGFLGYKPFFVTPRKGTVWSISGSDWLSSLTAGDVTGEVIVIVLPNFNVQSISSKRPGDRRFPLYKTAFLPHAPAPPDISSPVTEPLAGPLAESSEWEHFKPKSFRAAAGRFGLRFQDMDLRHFHRLASREPVKRMHVNETKGDLNMERVQLEAVHRVRFCPNLEAHAWVASAGHSGLVRLHCIQGLVSPVAWKLIQEKRAHFTAKFDETGGVGECDYSPEVQHCIVQM